MMPTHLIPSIVLLSIVPFPLAISASAQEIRPLGQPVARAAEGFTHTFDVAELVDGRVLVTDSQERSIALVDLTAGTVARIGRRGAGPREYESVFSILSRPDGSWGVYDAGQSRILVLSADGEILGAEAFVRPPLPGFSAPRGSDRESNWYIDVRTVGSNGLRREAVIYRWDPASGEVDSVAVAMQYSSGQGGPGIVPMPLGDAWSVLPDGSVARLAGADYVVDWWGPDGNRVSGPRIPHREVRADARERERWVEEMLARPAGAATMAGGRGSDRPSRTEVMSRLRSFDSSRFPDRVPPFRYGYTPASPRGHVWIGLDVESGAERTVFDVIGRDGRLIHRLSVDGRARVVGFGDDAVYLVRIDDFHLEWLERYAYPDD